MKKHSITKIRNAFNDTNNYIDPENGSEHQVMVDKVRKAWRIMQELNIYCGHTRNEIYEAIKKILDHDFVPPGIYFIDFPNLEDKGWYFDNDDTARAMDISIEEANEYVNKTYHAEVRVEHDGTTNFCYVNTEKRLNGIVEGGDSESTGDNEATKKDIKELLFENKVWRFISI